MNPPNSMTWRDLLERLPAGVNREVLERRLVTPEGPESRPWILNVFAGIGAWVSALFALPFFYLLDVFDHAATCGIVGIILTAGAIALSRSSKYIFPAQLALAALLSGNSLILTSVMLTADFDKPGFGLAVFMQCILAAIICAAFNGITGRFLSLVAIPSLAVAWVFHSEQPDALHIIIGLLALTTGVLFVWKDRSESWDVVAWACALSLPCVILLIELLHGNTWTAIPMTPLWPSSVMIGAILLWMVAKNAEGPAVLRRPWFMMMIGVIVLLATFTTPGILVAMMLVFLARAQDESFLAVIAHVFFAAFLVLFYYALNISLAHKSYIVAGSGVLLLLVRWAVSRVDPKEADS